MIRALAILTATAALAVAAHAHQHIAAGFFDANGNGRPDAGEPLRLVNPPAGNATFTLLPRTTGNYAGFLSLDEFPRTAFPNDYFTFTALSDGQVEIADPRAAKTGSQLWMEIRSVLGPAGGNFGFWEENASYTQSTPTASFDANAPTGNFRFILSEPIVPGDPTEDPYGHIHARGWTATAPGTYQVTFRLVDLGTSGAGGSAFHSPSQDYTFTFTAIPEPGTVALVALGLIALAGFARRRPA